MPHINYQPQPQRFGPRQTEDQKASIRADFAKLNLDAASTSALEILAASDRIDYGLVAAVVKHIVATADTPDGAILIFMPGVMEIRQCVTELQAASIGSVVILPLHANLSSAEQRRVFLPTKPRRKIVVATNVAETSVTIPDVVYVVDGGKVKETQYDADSGLQRLVETWTSRASAKQRRGRAGRTQPGQVGYTSRHYCIARSSQLYGQKKLMSSAISCTPGEPKTTACPAFPYPRYCVHRLNSSSCRSRPWTRISMSWPSCGMLSCILCQCWHLDR